MGQVQYHKSGDIFLRVDDAHFDQVDNTFDQAHREATGINQEGEEEGEKGKGQKGGKGK